METIYTIEFFIRKFRAIHEDEWGEGSLNNNCALSYCDDGTSTTAYSCNQSLALARIFDPQTTKVDIVYEINDGIWLNKRFPEHWFHGHKTPKQRILNALYDIYEKTYGRKYAEPIEAPKENITIIYKTVVIDSAVKELSETLKQN